MMAVWKDKDGLKQEVSELTCVEESMQQLNLLGREMASMSGDSLLYAEDAQFDVWRDLAREKGVLPVRSMHRPYSMYSLFHPKEEI